MLGKLYDRYEETTVYLEKNKDAVRTFNYLQLKNLCRAYAHLCGSVLFLSFLFERHFQLRSWMLIELGFAWGLFYLFKHAEDWFQKSHARVRCACLGVHALLVFVSILQHGMFFFRDNMSFLFLALNIFLSASYVDDMIVVAVYRFVVAQVYLVVEIILRGLEQTGWDFVIIIVSFVLSIYVSWMLLGVRTEQSQETSMFKDKGSRDLLTGLYNKLTFEEMAKNYINNRNNGEPCAFLIIDFDNFKSVNDNYGHLVGDQILKKFGEILSKNFRIKDHIGRVGGDEFMVVMTDDISDEYVRERCEIIQHELNVARIGQAGGFSCSIGVAYDNLGFTFEQLYMLADDALYEAKARGKKQYVKWDSKEIHIPEKKIIFLASADGRYMTEIQKACGDRYIYMQERHGTEALNGISLYQKYIDTVFFDYDGLDMDSAILHKYINSRPIFAKVPVHDVKAEFS